VTLPEPNSRALASSGRILCLQNSIGKLLTFSPSFLKN